jgi:hypothetical protein
MPTREELYERLKRKRRGKVRPQFFRSVAEKWGYSYEGTTGSHMQFKKSGQPKLTAKIVGGQHMHPAAIEELLDRITNEMGAEE